MAYQFNITAADGSVLSTQSTANVTYDKTTHKATLANGLDVTQYILSSPNGFVALASLPGFDNDDSEKDYVLNNIYVQHYQATHDGQSPPPVGSTSTLANFGSNMVNEMSLGQGSIFKKYLTWAAIIGGIVLAIIFRAEISALFKSMFGKKGKK